MDQQEKQPPQEPVKEQVQETVQQVQENVQQVVEQAQHKVTESRVPWYRALKRGRVLIGAYLVIFVIFSLLAWFVHTHPVLSVDVAITDELQDNTSPWLKYLMLAVSYPGSNTWSSILPVLLAGVAFWLVRLRLEAVFIIVHSFVSAILNGLIKYIVGRPRPAKSLVDVVQYVSGQSFPSGHVMAYVAFWGLLFSFGLILFKRDRWWHYLLLIIPALFVILVGPSRIYLGAHWASDVIGGYLFGGLLLGISLWLYLTLKSRGVLAPKVKKPGERLVEPPPQAAKATH